MREKPGPRHQPVEPLQIQTVLSKTFNTSLLIFLEPNNRLYAHQGGVPTLLKLYAVSTAKPWDSSNWRLPASCSGACVQASIEGPEQMRAAGHQHHQHAIGLQGGAQGTEHAAGVVEILEHIQAKHRIEAAFQAGQVRRDFGVDALDGHVGRAQKAVRKA